MTDRHISGLYAAPGGATEYCGPTAISAVTGMPIARVEDFVLAHRISNPPPRKNKLGGARVRTMWSSEVWAVLLAIGVRVVYHERITERLPTLAAFLRQRSEDKRAFIVLVTGHYIAVRNGALVDTRYRNPTPIEGIAKYKRARVRAYWIVEG